MVSKQFVATPIQLQILKYLLRVRGATIIQMVIGIEHLTSNSTNWSTRLRGMYEKTESLVSKGIIEKRPTKDKGNVFCLTSKGLEEVYIHLDIEDGYVGKGFQNDLGHLAYRTYVPPVTNQHFHLQTDVYNEVLNLMSEYPGVYDYRDNLHCVYSEQDAKGYLKPDGELLVDDDLYFIEVDRTKERGVELNNKFKNYAKHFEILKAKGQPLPAGIIFVIPNRKNYLERLRYDPEQKRFMSIFDKFKKECQSYLKDVRLIFVEIRKFKTQAIMLQNKNRLALKKQLLDKIRNSTPSTTLLNFGTWRGPSGVEYITLNVKDGGKPKYVMFLETEGYDSFTWTNGFNDCEFIASQYTTQELSESKKPTLYFACYYHQLHSVPPLLKANKDLQSIPINSAFHRNLYFLNAGGNDLIWYNNNHEIMDKSPFLY